MIKDAVRVDVAFTEHIALFEANSDRQQSKRELVGDVFELVTDLRPPRCCRCRKCRSSMIRSLRYRRRRDRR
jgi:hypothetical protein